MPVLLDLALRKAIESAISSKSSSGTVKMTLESYETIANNGEKPTSRDEIENNHCLNGLNVDGDIDAMLSQLEAYDAHLRNAQKHQTMNMNLLFFGPSGTCKSELARYIANRLDCKMIYKRISGMAASYLPLKRILGIFRFFRRS